jgi:hypothetical protein
MPELAEAVEKSTPAVDPEAFASLFFRPNKNRDEIWRQMVLIVRHAARGIRLPRGGDLEELKGDALMHAMEQIPNYKPKLRTAYGYFYEIIRNRLQYRVNRPQMTSLGDTDAEISFHDMATISPHDATREARTQCSNNWRSFQLACSRDRHLEEKYFRVTLKRLRTSFNASAARGERAVLAVMIETIKQVKRDQLG